MNCPDCDALLANEHWTIDPPLPPVVVPVGAAEPISQVNHQVLAWCELCQATFTTAVQIDRFGRFIGMGRIVRFTNPADVARVLKRLPRRGAGMTFLPRRRTRRRSAIK